MLVRYSCRASLSTSTLNPDHQILILHLKFLTPKSLITRVSTSTPSAPSDHAIRHLMVILDESLCAICHDMVRYAMSHCTVNSGPESGLSVPKRAYLSGGGPIRPEAGLSVSKRAYPSRGGPIRPGAGMSVPKRAYPFRGGPIRPEAGRSGIRRTYLSRGGPVQVRGYRGTSLKRKRTTPRPYRRPMHRVLGGS